MPRGGRRWGVARQRRYKPIDPGTRRARRRPWISDENRGVLRELKDEFVSDIRNGRWRFSNTPTYQNAMQNGTIFEKGLASTINRLPEIGVISVSTRIAKDLLGKRKRKGNRGTGPRPKQPKPDGESPSFNRRLGKSSPVVRLDFFIN